MTALLKRYLFLSLHGVLGFVHLNVIYWEGEVLQCCFFVSFLINGWAGRRRAYNGEERVCIAKQLFSCMWEVIVRKPLFFEVYAPCLLLYLALKTFCLSSGSMVCEAWNGTVHAKRMITARANFQVCTFIIQIVVRKTVGTTLVIHITYLIGGLLLLISGPKVSLGPWKGSYLDSAQCQGLKDWSTWSLALGRLYWLVWWASLSLWFYSG